MVVGLKRCFIYRALSATAVLLGSANILISNAFYLLFRFRQHVQSKLAWEDAAINAESNEQHVEGGRGPAVHQRFGDYFPM